MARENPDGMSLLKYCFYQLLGEMASQVLASVGNGILNIHPDHFFYEHHCCLTASAAVLQPLVAFLDTVML